MTDRNFHQLLLDNFNQASSELREHPEHQSTHWEKFNAGFREHFNSPEKWAQFRKHAFSKGMDDTVKHKDLIDHTNPGAMLKAVTILKETAGPDFHPFIEESPIGDPATEEVAGMWTSKSAIDFTYFAWRIARSVSFRREAPILFLEIGGGFGGLTRVLKLYFPNAKFILLDLPEANALSTYFLHANFPHSRFFLLTDLRNGENLDWNTRDFAILPGWCSEHIAPRVADYVINTRSMQEMTRETIRYYFSEIERLIKPGGLFYCVNRYIKKIGDENIVLAEYPFDANWKFIFSQPKWLQNHIHELIAQRLVRPNPEFPHPELRKLPR